MANYKEMYHRLLVATEKAITELIDAQRKCEQMYIDANDPNITVLQKQNEPSDKA